MHETSTLHQQRRFQRPRWLIAIAGLFGVALCAVYVWHHSAEDADAAGVRVVWMFEAAEPGAIITSPLHAGEFVYVGAIVDSTSPPGGAVYALSAASGRVFWRFNDGGALQHMYSSPHLADGRLYIGEGMHANPRSKLYCLDANNGEKLWEFQAFGHIESTPQVSQGRVFFGAGDDGVYCLDAVTGEQHWHLEGVYHVDVTLAVEQQRVFGGSGMSRLRRAKEAFCLDAQTGEVVWRVPMDLPVWGSPRVDEGQVYFGLSNGRLVKSAQPPETPAGAIVCLQAEDGVMLWRYDVTDGVLVQVATDEAHLYFGARDGFAYCLDRHDGRLIWKQPLGSPIVASPTLTETGVWFAASEGSLYLLDRATGKRRAMFDVAAASSTEPRLFSTPSVFSVPGQAPRILLGAELRGWAASSAVVYCLCEEPAK